MPRPARCSVSPSGSSNRMAGRDERLDEWSGRRARRARDLDAGTVPLQDGRDSGGDGVETSVDVNFRARSRAGHGAKPVTERTMAERGRGLRGFELGPGVAGRQRIDAARGVVVKRQVPGGQEREGEAGDKRAQRYPRPHPQCQRPHLESIGDGAFFHNFRPVPDKPPNGSNYPVIRRIRPFVAEGVRSVFHSFGSIGDRSPPGRPVPKSAETVENRSDPLLQ